MSFLQFKNEYKQSINLSLESNINYFDDGNHIALLPG